MTYILLEVDDFIALLCVFSRNPADDFCWQRCGAFQHITHQYHHQDQWSVATLYSRRDWLICFVQILSLISWTLTSPFIPPCSSFGTMCNTGINRDSYSTKATKFRSAHWILIVTTNNSADFPYLHSLDHSPFRSAHRTFHIRPGPVVVCRTPCR